LYAFWCNYKLLAVVVFNSTSNWSQKLECACSCYLLIFLWGRNIRRLHKKKLGNFIWRNRSQSLGRKTLGRHDTWSTTKRSTRHLVDKDTWSTRHLVDTDTWSTTTLDRHDTWPTRHLIDSVFWLICKSILGIISYDWFYDIIYRWGNWHMMQENVMH